MTHDLTRPWLLNTTQWMIANGVHDPWIAEISPAQFGTFSDKQRARYQSKRSEQWQAATACKVAFSDALVSAYRAGLFTLEEATKDARERVEHILRTEAEAAAKETARQARENAFLFDLSGLKQGDEVYDRTNCRGTVVKVFRRSATVYVPSLGREYKFHAGSIAKS